MDMTFAGALAQLGPDAAFRIVNEARPPADYLFATFLPERRSTSYHVENGRMTVRTTMAGLVGMDSPYPPSGQISVSKFLEESAKIANMMYFPERALRELQGMLMLLRLNGGDSNQRMVEEVLNFTDKVIAQAHIDTFEWLRGQALCYGAIDWSFNQKRLLVNYGFPAANLLPTRTTAGGTAYGAAGSVFWSDMRTANRILKYNRRAIVMHPSTLDEILGNDANKMEVLSQAGNVFRIRRLIGTLERPASDARDMIELITYDREGEVIDPANPEATIKIPYMPPGLVLHVARNERSGYRVGEGSTDDPQNDAELGYTHIGPTIEGNGQPGRWGRVFTPEGRPMQLQGEGVSNGLPVIEAPDKIVVTSTELAA